MSKLRAAITAIEGYVPEGRLTNQELEQMVETNDEWIVTRTGIKERRIERNPGVALSDMAAIPIKRLLEKKNIDPAEIDLIICGTITGDYPFPSSAQVLCDKVGATKAWGFDINAACSGFVYGLTIGQQFIETGFHKKVLVVGMDKMSSIVDYQNRDTCIIFGDGGGVALLEPTTEEVGIMDAIMESDGAGRHYLLQRAGGSLNPITHEHIDNREQLLYQEGKTVFKYAVASMADVSAEIMERNGLSADDVTWLVPHQANLRIIDATAKRVGLGSEKVMVNIEKYGNTTAGTIPLLLWEYEHLLKKGDTLILSAFGGGFTWGAIYLKWAYDS